MPSQNTIVVFEVPRDQADTLIADLQSPAFAGHGMTTIEYADGKGAKISAALLDVLREPDNTIPLAYVMAECDVNKAGGLMDAVKQANAHGVYAILTATDDVGEMLVTRRWHAQEGQWNEDKAFAAKQKRLAVRRDLKEQLEADGAPNQVTFDVKAEDADTLQKAFAAARINTSPGVSVRSNAKLDSAKRRRDGDAPILATVGNINIYRTGPTDRFIPETLLLFDALSRVEGLEIMIRTPDVGTPAPARLSA